MSTYHLIRANTVLFIVEQQEKRYRWLEYFTPYVTKPHRDWQQGIYLKVFQNIKPISSSNNIKELIIKNFEEFL